MDSKTTVTKETKNKIRVDYEGKLSFKERLQSKLKASNTWIKAGVTVLRFILMLGVSYVILFPFFSRIANSFMTQEDIINPTVSLIPTNFTIQIYRAIFIENNYLLTFLNTIILSLVSAILQMFVACLIGYGLAKFKFKGNKALMIMVIVTMIIPHVALRESMYYHFNSFDFFAFFGLGNDGIIAAITGSPIYLTGSTIPIYILSACGLAFKNGLYIYLMRQFFKGIPDELEESAYVDGAGTFRTFIQIILPLAVPMMITIFIFAFSWQWTDEFYINMFYMAGEREGRVLMPDLYTNTIFESLPIGSAGKEKYTNVIQNTAGLMIIAPLVIIYLFCQKYLVQGIERSGLVG